MAGQSLLKKITSPSRYALGTLVAVGVALGAVGVLAFDFTMHATNTDEFCVSCHELEDNALREFVGTSHHTNSTGARATCGDCHVPKEFIPKMARKVAAIGEIYHHVLGTIDTREKYDEHRMWMASKTWEFMKSRDSQECRNCHGEGNWQLDMQSEKAQQYHSGALAKGKTCIDCHKGLAHELPPGIREDTMFNGNGHDDGDGARTVEGHTGEHRESEEH